MKELPHIVNIGLCYTFDSELYSKEKKIIVHEYEMHLF